MVRHLSEERKKIEEEIEEILVTERKNRLRRLKSLNYMKCPKCGNSLTETDRNWIKIDICSACGGVWLDAGEMDAIAILERSAF
jgi:ribosomal protein L37AE/L43A